MVRRMTVVPLTHITREEPAPHWYPEGTYNGKRVEESEMTKEQIREYMIGFAENEADLDFKDW